MWSITLPIESNLSTVKHTAGGITLIIPNTLFGVYTACPCPVGYPKPKPRERCRSKSEVMLNTPLDFDFDFDFDTSVGVSKWQRCFQMVVNLKPLLKNAVTLALI